MSAHVPESISALLVEFAVKGNAAPPRNPNDVDDEDEDEDDDEDDDDDESDPAVIREPDE
jgi:hypothetical protein